MTEPERTWETARIAARPAAMADAQVLHDEFATDAAVARYMTWTPHRSVDDPRAFLGRCERLCTEASARLLERVGMQREGVLRRWQIHPNVAATPRDCYCYAIVKAD
jgi:RimJ/RimL family protein N-acetyltransferase